MIDLSSARCSAGAFVTYSFSGLNEGRPRTQRQQECAKQCTGKDQRNNINELHSPLPLLIITPSTFFHHFTTPLQTHFVCKLPLTTPNPTSAPQLSTKTTLKAPQNCPTEYCTSPSGTLKYAITRLAGRKRIVNFVRSRVMRVRCSTSRDSLRVRREKFCGCVSEFVWEKGFRWARSGLQVRRAIPFASDTLQSHSERTNQ
jgi:hypothetical protein